MSPRLSLHNVDFAAVEKRARRERSEAVHRLLVQPLLNLFAHAARPDRHRQGTHRRAAA
jgi:hypothetical protein